MSTSPLLLSADQFIQLLNELQYTSTCKILPSTHINHTNNSNTIPNVIFHDNTIQLLLHIIQLHIGNHSHMVSHKDMIQYQAARETGYDMNEGNRSLDLDVQQDEINRLQHDIDQLRQQIDCINTHHQYNDKVGNVLQKYTSTQSNQSTQTNKLLHDKYSKQYAELSNDINELHHQLQQQYHQSQLQCNELLQHSNTKSPLQQIPALDLNEYINADKQVVDQLIQLEQQYVQCSNQMIVPEMNNKQLYDRLYNNKLCTIDARLQSEYATQLYKLLSNYIYNKQLPCISASTTEITADTAVKQLLSVTEQLCKICVGNMYDGIQLKYKQAVQQLNYRKTNYIIDVVQQVSTNHQRLIGLIRNNNVSVIELDQQVQQLIDAMQQNKWAAQPQHTIQIDNQYDILSDLLSPYIVKDENNNSYNSNQLLHDIQSQINQLKQYNTIDHVYTQQYHNANTAYQSCTQQLNELLIQYKTLAL